jgi:hypothetical protein
MGKSVNKFAMATVFSAGALSLFLTVPVFTACFYCAQKRRSPLTLRLRVGLQALQARIRFAAKRVAALNRGACGGAGP